MKMRLNIKNSGIIVPGYSKKKRKNDNIDISQITNNKTFWQAINRFSRRNILGEEKLFYVKVRKLFPMLKMWLKP